MSIPELNFIILKINDTDCHHLSRDETIGVFLKAKEPIVVQVRRRDAEDGNDQLYLFDKDGSQLLKYKSRSLSGKNTQVNVECQTDLPCCCAELDCPIKNNEDDRYHRLNTTGGVFNQFLVPGIDLEEVILNKARSDEKLGLTVSYSSVNSSASASDSDDDEVDNVDILNHDEDNNECGNIFICHIQQDSIAARDGRLRQGDQIIQINGRDISSKNETESLFAENRNSITLLVSRCVCTDDELLDSAIYCDDKDQNTGISLSLDCEASIYSSKSSLHSFSEVQTQQPPLPTISKLKISTCDHTNIRQQLESVNKEISLLNSQISSMKLNKNVGQSPKTSKGILQSEIRQPMVETASLESSEKRSKDVSSLTNQYKNLEKHAEPSRDQQRYLQEQKRSQTYKNTELGNKNANIRSHRACAMEIEHIYETIPEDYETDSYYSSPIDEHKDRTRIEQWLKSQEQIDQSSGLSSQTETFSSICVEQSSAIMTTTAEQGSPLNQANITRIYRHNSILDDYENSSSAYNTGDSCTSNLLTIEQKFNDINQSSSTLVNQLYSRQQEAYECTHCKLRYGKDKETMKSSRKSLTEGEMQSAIVVKKSQHQQGLTNSPNINTRKLGLRKPVKMHKKLLRKTVTNTQHNVNDVVKHIGAVSQENVLSKCNILTKEKAQLHANNQSTDDLTNLQHNAIESTQMVWKVKRRADGTRYIVRRPTKSSSIALSTRNQHAQQEENSHNFIDRRNEVESSEIFSSVGAAVIVKDEILTVTEARTLTKYNQNTTRSHINDGWSSQKYKKKIKETRPPGHREQKRNKLVKNDCNVNVNNKCGQIQKQWLI